MSLKTKFNPMGALGTKYYQITVSTSPSNATCYILYNNVWYNTKSLKVKANSVIQTYVTHTTYGTSSTYTYTIDSNKTIYFTGSSTAVYTDTLWTQPTLSSNGTSGTSELAVSASGQMTAQDGSGFHFYAWRAFDGVASGRNGWVSSTKNSGTLSFTTSKSIKIKSVSITAYTYVDNTRIPKNVTLKRGSTSLVSVTGNTSKTFSLSVPSSKQAYGTTHSISITASNHSGYAPGIWEVYITAYYKVQTGTSYSWNSYYYNS